MPEGVPTFEGLLESASRAGDRGASALLLARIAAIRLAGGDMETGAEWALRGLALAEDLGAWYASGFCIAALARTAASRGEAAAAARLHGSLLPIIGEVMAGFGPGGAELYEAAIAPARVRLGAAEFDRLAADAALLDRDASVTAASAYARSLRTGGVASEATTPGQIAQGPSVRAAFESPPLPLTPRELDILRELMTGATNQQIGVVLGLRPKTVMHHSVSIYSKLGVRGRTEAAALAYRSGMSSARERSNSRN